MKTKILLTAIMVINSIILNAQTIMNIHQSNGSVLQIPLNTIDSITYTITNPGNLAIISTLPIGNITSTSATSGGNITNNGGTPVTQRGIVWSTSPNPTTANYSTADSSLSVSYSSNLTGLTNNTTYYVRAYATNSAGTSYGNELSFTTASIFIGSISTLNCSSANHYGNLISNTASSGVSSVIVYNGGNGGPHNGQVVNSLGVTGLTATLAPGTFAIDYDSLTYTITGTPSSSGIATFSLNIGGQTCTLTRIINSGIVTNPGPGVTFDGYSYPSIVLGNGQEWMAENLRTTVYSNGDSIPNVTDDSEWSSLTTGAWAHYNNDILYENPYGKWYNWFTITDPRNVCPTGWHVPTDSEWSALINYLDPNSNGGNDNTAGGKMKSIGTQFWWSPNTAATNESGFSGYPSGNRTNAGYCGGIGTESYWWSSSPDPYGSGWICSLVYNSSNAWTQHSTLANNGFPVRCLKD
jgi:uncharacterized protein (TIGR02145 family)